MTYLHDALEAVVPGRVTQQEANAAESWLAERDIRVSVDYAKRARAEQAAYQAAKKQRADDRFAAAPIYEGQVSACMANVFPSRGAPYRCNKGGRLRVVRDSYGGKPMAVCRRHVRDESVSEYTGWAGNPNPRLDMLEAEEAAKLDGD